MEKKKFIMVGEDKKCPDCGFIIEPKVKHAYENEWCPSCGLNLDIVKERFYGLYKDGKVTADKIHDYIDDWHNGNSKEELHIYLGMTKEQYAKWFKDGVL